MHVRCGKPWLCGGIQMPDSGGAISFLRSINKISCVADVRGTCEMFSGRIDVSVITNIAVNLNIIHHFWKLSKLTKKKTGTMPLVFVCMYAALSSYWSVSGWVLLVLTVTCCSSLALSFRALAMMFAVTLDLRIFANSVSELSSNPLFYSLSLFEPEG